MYSIVCKSISASVLVGLILGVIGINSASIAGGLNSSATPVVTDVDRVGKPSDGNLEEKAFASHKAITQAVKGVVDKRLSNAKFCADQVRAGAIKGGGMAEFRCVMTSKAPGQAPAPTVQTPGAATPAR
jgi:hypothetical protein